MTGIAEAPDEGLASAPTISLSSIFAVGAGVDNASVDLMAARLDGGVRFSAFVDGRHASGFGWHGMKVVTGDFNSAYVVKVNSKRSGGPAAPGMPAETNMTIEAKWLGPCKPGQKAGDMILPGGQKINVLDLQKFQMPGGPGGPPRPGAPQPK